LVILTIHGAMRLLHPAMAGSGVSNV